MVVISRDTSKIIQVYTVSFKRIGDFILRRMTLKILRLMKELSLAT